MTGLIRIRNAGRMWVWLAVIMLVTMSVVTAGALYLLNVVSGTGLQVESAPDGASVFVNGRLAGATPLKLRGISSGTYAVRIEKSGWSPVNLKVDVPSSGARVNQKLSPMPLSTLIVHLKPDDAEVLVDGDLMGHTPLRLENVPEGPHELLVRKTNFASYAQRFEAQTGQVTTFEGIELADKILELLENQVKAEPQRIGHYIDLAHYYFTNQRMEEAAEMFARAEQVSRIALNFDGAGYAGKDKMSPVEIALEQRLRHEDESRLPKEIDKHRQFPKYDTRVFRMKLREAEDDMRKMNLRSFALAELTAKEHIVNRSYDRAARAYQDFIEAATPAKSPDLPKAYIALIEVQCMKDDPKNALATFNTFFNLFAKDGPMLRACGHALLARYSRLTAPAQQTAALEAAEKAILGGLEFPADAESKAQALFDLGAIQMTLNRGADAVKSLRESVAQTKSAPLREERQLKFAEALAQSGDKGALAEAVALYEQLKNSARATIQESANYGLIAIKQPNGKK